MNEGDRQTGDVRQLECDVAVEPGIDETGGGVNEEAEPAEAGLALHPAHQIIGYRHPFQGGPEHELTGMQYERIPVVGPGASSFPSRHLPT